MQPRILNEFAHFSLIQIVICHGTRLLLLSAMNSGLPIIVLGSVFFFEEKKNILVTLSAANFHPGIFLVLVWCSGYNTPNGNMVYMK